MWLCHYVFSFLSFLKVIKTETRTPSFQTMCCFFFQIHIILADSQSEN